MDKLNGLRNAVSKLRVPAIIAFGNPLLDILVVLKNNDLLEKFNLKLDDEKELPADMIEELIDDLASSDTDQRLSAGGSAQNTLRILQWLCNDNLTFLLGRYYGGLGNDSRGKILQELVKAAGVDARYAIHPDMPSGICVSLITGVTRSLVANIGAAEKYELEDLNKNDLPLDTVRIIYIEGFFLTHSWDVVNELVKRIQNKNIILAFNLNGVYIFKEHHALICKMVGLAKIVFGNAREIMALAQVLDIKYDNIGDIPFMLNHIKRTNVNKTNTTTDNWLAEDDIFVMTQGGSAPATVVWGNGKSVQVQPVVPKSPILDTTGAGDSLVAGFLAGILAGQDPKTCLEWGCKVASYIITRLGVNLPSHVPLDLL